jgi:hypothetical protein
VRFSPTNQQNLGLSSEDEDALLTSIVERSLEQYLLTPCLTRVLGALSSRAHIELEEEKFAAKLDMLSECTQDDLQISVQLHYPFMPIQPISAQCAASPYA